MRTLNTEHIGDGAYIGTDTSGHQIWLGANHHENMLVALGPDELIGLARWLYANHRGVLKEMANVITENEND